MSITIITATKPMSDRLTFRDVLQGHETRISSAFGTKFGNDSLCPSQSLSFHAGRSRPARRQL
jgi:hypothetical protein